MSVLRELPGKSMSEQRVADERIVVRGTPFHIFRTLCLDTQHSTRHLQFECALYPLLRPTEVCCAKSSLQDLAQESVPGH